MSKVLRTLSLCIVGACIVLIQACSTDESVVDSKSTSKTGSGYDEMRSHMIAKSGVEATNDMLNKAKSEASIQDFYDDLTKLCPNVTTAGEGGGWYKFYAEAGSTVTIEVNRTGCGMDPAIYVFNGLSTSFDDFLYFADDEQSPYTSCGCWYDPYLSFTAPNTGWYTLNVWQYAGCDEGLGFDVIVTGTICDSDGDGLDDPDDAYPNSDLQTNVVIDGCDSGIPNHWFDNGATMMDYLNTCAADAANHDEYVSCVASRTNAWKSAGLITGNQKGKIQSCAGQSSLP